MMQFVNPACLNIENNAANSGVLSPTFTNSFVTQGAILFDLCVSSQDLVTISRIDSMQSWTSAKSCIGLQPDAIIAIEIGKTDGVDDGELGHSVNNKSSNAFMQPNPYWSLKGHHNVRHNASSPQWTVETVSAGRYNKRRRTKEANGYFDTPLYTQDYSPASQLSDFNSYYPTQESSADLGGYSVIDAEIKETEYSKKFVAECLLPFSPIQDKLLILFFKHVHPMFPIMDEFSFMEIYEKHRTSNDLIAPEHFLLLLAISFVAFAVCTTNPQHNNPKSC